MLCGFDVVGVDDGAYLSPANDGGREEATLTPVSLRDPGLAPPLSSL